MNEYQIKVITPPAIEPVTLSEAKLDLRVDHTADDTLIASLIVAARAMQRNGHAVRSSNRTLELSLSAWPADNIIRLPLPPAVSVTSITYYDESNASAVMSASDYIAITDIEPGVITLAKGRTWPTATLRSIAPIRVRYVAGYGTTHMAVPERYKSLIRGLVAIRYENRNEMTANAERQLSHLRSALQTEWGW